MKCLVGLLACCAVGLRLAAAGSPSGQPPNIVLIVADDLGFNEMGFQNSSRGLHTPNLDALAHEGVILRNYYVQPICSPTRSALMTGRYPIHLGTQSNVIYWNTPWGIALNETFVGQNLQDAGYRTAMYGKWHLGMASQAMTPQARGFDEEAGFRQGCGDYYYHIAADCNLARPVPYTFVGYDWNENSDIDYTAHNVYSAKLIADKAVAYINKSASSKDPFFLYTPFQNVHEPFEAEAEYIQLCLDQPTADLMTICGMIAELDDKVGEIVAALKATGQYDNTVIVFTSDNGAPNQGDVVKNLYTSARDFPLKGYKTQIWEGGVRVPAFVHSPLLSKPGRVSEELFHVTDWLPTFVGLAKGNTSRNLDLDGYDIWESVSEGAASPRDEILHNINPLCDAGQAGKPKAGVRSGDMKLLCECYDGAKSECTGQRYLYNITADPTESKDLSASQPSTVKQLEGRLAAYNAKAVIPMQWEPPYQGPDYYCANCPLGNTSEPYHAWRPWLKSPPSTV